MEQRDRITPAGNADEIAVGWRKFWNKFGITVQGAVAPNKRSTAGPERKSNGWTATNRSPYGSRKKFQKTAAAWCITLLAVWRRSAEPLSLFVGSTRVSPYQQTCLACAFNQFEGASPGWTTNQRCDSLDDSEQAMRVP
jgi:hypothetical protein